MHGIVTLLHPASTALSASRWALLLLVAGAAGTLDAIVGGGGLIQLPGLLILLPHQPVVTLLGTNKLASVWGTSSAATVYVRRVGIVRALAIRLACAAALTSFAGALLATRVRSTALRPLVVLALFAIWLHVWRRPALGVIDAAAGIAQRPLVLVAVAAAIGLYDGFVGPGTGTLLVFAYVGLGALDFLRASALAKVTNVATNLGAIVLFAATGHVVVSLGLAMGAANAAGAQLGTRLAIARGVRWVRTVYLVVVAALLVRVAFDVVAALR